MNCRFLGKYLTLLIIGIICIVEIVVLESSPDSTQLFVFYGVWKILKSLINEEIKIE